MKKLLSLLLSLVLLCGTAACSSQYIKNNIATESVAVAESTQETAKVAEITGATPEARKAMETLEKQGYRGIAYVVQNGKVLGTYVKDELKNGKAVTLDTPMPIGSVSKQFCAAAILLLQEQGKLSIDDTLDKYFPEATKWYKITLKNMLSMRSGIINYTGDIELFEDFINSDKSSEENEKILVKRLMKKDLEFQPDKYFTYSNSNYLLLANIVEKVSGEKYIDFLRKNFFKPLGMTQTGSLCELDTQPVWAKGCYYEELKGDPVKGDGDLVSTGADMALWMNGLKSGKVISEKSYKTMIENHSDGSNYGYGMEVNLLSGVGHGGSIDVYRAQNYINEEKDLVLFMVSTESCEAVFSDLVLNLLK